MSSKNTKNSVNFYAMGFKENLKSELIYTGMMVKELSAITGIKRHTLDNYLNTHNAIPSAETAVKIAKTLGVTVEYLITGKDHYSEAKLAVFPEDLRTMIEMWNSLNTKSRKIALAMVKTLKEQEDEGKK